VSKPKPDLSPLLPDDATLKARRQALVDAVGPGGQDPQRAPRWRRRGPRLALGAAMAAAVIVAVLIFRADGDPTPEAFAVEPQEGGGVTIKVYSLEDASGLEDALEDVGIRAQVTWLPPGTTCDERRFTPSIAKLPGGGGLSGFEMAGPGALTISVADTQRARRGPVANVNLDPAAFRADQSIVLFGSPKPFGGDPEGGFEAHFQVVEGPVEPCRPVSAPAGSIGSIPLPKNATGKPAPAPLEAPAPGQFLYTKTKVVQLQGWEPDGSGAGPRDKPRDFTANLLGPEADALPARVATVKEVWMAPDGTTRERETLDQVEFLSAGDQERWEDAGSPLPFAYDPTEHAVERDGAGRPVKEYASRSWRGRHEFDSVTKLSKLPTEPEALRLAIENRGGNSAPHPSPAATERGAATAERLLEILREPITTPALRGAAIGALVEIPGIALEHDVTDAVGRQGDALIWVRDRGFGHRVTFDPRTSDVLAEAEMIFDADAAEYPGVPDNTVYRETAYLQSEIVDSDRERPSDATK
jgi:hypothetical protein